MKTELAAAQVVDRDPLVPEMGCAFNPRFQCSRRAVFPLDPEREDRLPLAVVPAVELEVGLDHTEPRPELARRTMPVSS